MSKYDFGIDLGTTNSVISVMRGMGDKRPVTIAVDGKQTLPSCVKLSNGRFVVGRAAYDDRYKPCSIYSVKRFMGTDHKITLVDEITEEIGIFTPVEISAEILKKLKVTAEKTYGEGNVVDVTITVPAAFNHNQREATKEAGELAGFNVVKIINEPTSAALAYGLDSISSDELIAVYDLGGGTFDISVLNISGLAKEDAVDVFDILGKASEGDSRNFRVVTKEGDTRLGGDDIDQLVLEMALVNLEKKAREELILFDGNHAFKFEEKCKLESLLSDEDKEKLLLKVEQFKKLGTGANYNVPIEFDIADAWPGNNVKLKTSIVISSEDFNKASDAIYKKTVVLLNKCLARLKGAKINKLVLVGGSTKSIRIQQNITRDYDFNVFSGLNPDEAVGLGAAVQTSITKGQIQSSIMDVVPESIGIEIISVVNGRSVPGIMRKLVKRDELIPASATRNFSTTYDNQDVIVIRVFQGSSELVDDNLLLGELRIPVEPKDAGESKADVTLKVDGNGILYCYVRVDGVLHEQELINVFGTSIKKDVVGNKKYLKWTRRYKTLAIENPVLLQALEDYKLNPTSELESNIATLFQEYNEAEERSVEKNLELAEEDFAKKSNIF